MLTNYTNAPQIELEIIELLVQAWQAHPIVRVRDTIVTLESGCCKVFPVLLELSVAV